MKRSEKVYRNQVMITSIDEMIDENSVIRVIDAYVLTLQNITTKLLLLILMVLCYAKVFLFPILKKVVKNFLHY